ncbi:hypothetical protein MYSTI_06048 [Myxococcus stipitatus DSM 14675]|uniref:Secreted protein n=1 Tax=Myxococcus stipitatus (strain DSM 14675 / JCM 12634 / Mx s8) TaxID=1278073 RepID=L7UEH3_MYXSD|nr:hypothetical protein [Myxococcus stipitatus]AGC47321.1 hypothetical protein MYSTI_06048 [Myxococcus stipitatus DSM 14675]
MFSSTTSWCARLLAVGLLVSSGAEARFGKRSDSDDTKPRHGSSADPDTHEATPIGVEDDDGDDAPEAEKPSHPDSGGCCSEPLAELGGEVVGSLLGVILSGAIETIATSGTHLSSDEPDTEVSAERRHAVPLSFRTGAQKVFLQDEGRGTDLFIALEGRRFGVEGHVALMSLPRDDGGAGEDDLTLVEAHLTYALLVHQAVRLRAEAGVSTARAPDATFVGPSLALAVEACVVGPLDVEARVQLTPVPYLQVDATAGLALHLGGLVLRGGWRGFLLDDLGSLDGEAHQDRLHGPFVGGGLTF